jgi:hypothetical protein
MKRKLSFIAALLLLAVLGVVVISAGNRANRSSAGGWQFITNRDGSIGLVRADNESLWRVVAHVSTNATNSLGPAPH